MSYPIWDCRNTDKQTSLSHTKWKGVLTKQIADMGKALDLPEDIWREFKKMDIIEKAQIDRIRLFVLIYI